MFMKLWEEHPGTMVGIGVGAFVGLIFLLVGFWKTIIFSGFIALGFYFGKKYDNNEDLRDVLEEILPDKFFK
ncbi:hypothetical protein BHF71_04825 [Vulcanibacillus modesticaldus]|uniref:DUF2273 domain-containing protein n=1 Tax=Vulcanibacillus modesticaldus TaxID=337097 RepID=A0A1D2YRU1_9BACI|nr:DUF2273 domain-containing protein [Vulcanibacillus modesticaldus]OEF95518.1 hypothetical protein BHF71_04825 [Vulcanibacillus modesticaldus]